MPVPLLCGAARHVAQVGNPLGDPRADARWTLELLQEAVAVVLDGIHDSLLADAAAG
jgi:hypothetical protein